MTVYIDDAQIMYKGKLRYHMIADSLPELHAFAASVNIKRCWYHAQKRHPHYDITHDQKAFALTQGAIEIGDAEFVALARKLGIDSRKG